MAGSMTALSVTVACLTDQEWPATTPMLGMSPDERVGMQCLLAELGGPAELAQAMTAAQEGEFTNLVKAGPECGLEMGTPARAACPVLLYQHPTRPRKGPRRPQTPATTLAVKITRQQSPPLDVQVRAANRPQTRQ